MVTICLFLKIVLLLKYIIYPLFYSAKYTSINFHQEIDDAYKNETFLRNYFNILLYKEDISHISHFFIRGRIKLALKAVVNG